MTTHILYSYEHFIPVNFDLFSYFYLVIKSAHLYCNQSVERFSRKSRVVFSQCIYVLMLKDLSYLVICCCCFTFSETSVISRFIQNCLLLILFIGQHSVMATTWFKEKMAICLHITVSQRMVYVASTSVCMLVSD